MYPTLTSQRANVCLMKSAWHTNFQYFKEEATDFYLPHKS